MIKLETLKKLTYLYRYILIITLVCIALFVVGALYHQETYNQGYQDGQQQSMTSSHMDESNTIRAAYSNGYEDGFKAGDIYGYQGGYYAGNIYGAQDYIGRYCSQSYNFLLPDRYQACKKP